MAEAASISGTKKAVILIGVAALLFVIFFSRIRLGVLTAVFMWDMLDGSTLHAPDRGKLAWLTSRPAMKTVEIAGKNGRIDADLYYLEGRKPRAGLLLTHGIIEDGKNDPRLRRFAYSLARAGFTVLVPDLKGMKSFRIAFSDVDDIVASTHYLATLKDIVDPAKLGLMGFSYAAGPTLMAAAAPELRDHVKFVVSFGGYYDPIDVIRFITTGYFEYGREKGYLQPQPYGKWVFFQNNVDYVGNENDRKILREIFRNEQMETPENVRPLLQGLTPNGKYVYELLTNTDPNRTADLVQKIDPRLREYLQKLSLAPVVPAIRARFIIGHGNTDPLIPYTESLRLADAVGDKSRVHAVILRLFAHVDPSQNTFSFKQYFTVYIPSAFQFYSLIYDLLSQQQ